jgi:phosphoadenosine phosphosulfate reductase
MSELGGRPEFRTGQELDRANRVGVLNERYATASAQDVLRAAIREEFPGAIAIVSSFGAESAVLLHLAAEIDRSTPVIFLDTEKHFPETLSYRDTLVSSLGLRDVRRAMPDPLQIELNDLSGTLHAKNPELCCHLRKTLPMVRALQGFACWVTGRKRYQNHDRASLSMFESQDRWFKLNPLARWTRSDIQDYMKRHDLPVHPRVPQGYASIGCAPCTTPALAGDPDERAGRWRGFEKNECGIHFVDGKAVPAAESPDG